MKPIPNEHRVSASKKRSFRKPSQDKNRHKSADTDPVWLYGRHAVAAALSNSARRFHRVLATKNALDWIEQENSETLQTLLQNGLRLEEAKPQSIDKLLRDGAVHQGLAAEVDPLPPHRLKEVCDPALPSAPVVVLDQVTDPQNIGAIFRTSAAMGSKAVIVQDRRTPQLEGALAKAAAGAIETVPCVRVVNVSRALEALTNIGYMCAGLSGSAKASIQALPRSTPLAIVVGAEGVGLRQKVAEHCSALFRIDISTAMESLNVSNAAAIALYEATRDQRTQTDG